MCCYILQAVQIQGQSKTISEDTQEMPHHKSQPPLNGWSGGAKVSCILCHLGVQLILAYSWARPAILVEGKGRRRMFLFLLFLHFHSCSSLPCSSLSSPLLSLLSLFSLPQRDDTK